MRKTIAPPPLSGGGQEHKLVGSGVKNFFWGVGQKEIFYALTTAEEFLLEIGEKTTI